MSTTSKTQPRRLTVTYYVEPQNLRTITVPVQRANVLIFGLVGAVMWTVASGLFLGMRLVTGDRAEPAAVASETQVAKPAPTNDQTLLSATPQASHLVAASILSTDDRNHVAGNPAAAVKAADLTTSSEAAKPADLKNATEVAKATDLAKIAAAAKTANAAKLPKPAEPANDVLPAEPVTAVAVNSPPATAFGPPELTPKAASEPLTARLFVKDAAFAYKPDDGVFNLDFKIQNKGKPEAKGKVWGVATFATKAGKHLEIASASGVGFRAKSMTVKALQFPLPPSEPGYIAEVTIHVSEDASTDEMTSTYRLDETGQALR